jgi:hypothetical protein
MSNGEGAKYGGDLGPPNKRCSSVRATKKPIKRRRMMQGEIAYRLLSCLLVSNRSPGDSAEGPIILRDDYENSINESNHTLDSSVKRDS